MEIPLNNEMQHQDGDMTNGSMLDGEESQENMAFKEARPMHKAKRHFKQAYKMDETNGVVMTSPVKEDMAGLAASKNSKKSRMGRGRGLPKKGILNDLFPDLYLDTSVNFATTAKLTSYSNKCTPI